MGVIHSRMSWKTVSTALLCAALVTGCAHRRNAKKGLGAEDTAAEGAAANEGAGVLGPGVDADEAAIRGKEFMSVSDLQVIYFDYDQYELSEKARATLQTNSAYLKDHPDLEVLVEGHCDERGTTEYNLALGQKRAASVRDYYVRLGVPGKSVGTLSFGEERPACNDRTEECWANNRRAVSKVRAQVSSVPKQPGDNP